MNAKFGLAVMWIALLSACDGTKMTVSATGANSVAIGVNNGVVDIKR